MQIKGFDRRDDKEVKLDLFIRNDLSNVLVHDGYQRCSYYYGNYVHYAMHHCFFYRKVNFKFLSI